MKFKILQDNLRKVLWERIEAGELTGLRLAQQTGFKQAHISNSPNGKRGPILEAMNKFFPAQPFSVPVLPNPPKVKKRPPTPPPNPDKLKNSLPPAPPTAATQPLSPVCTSKKSSN